MIHRVYVYDCGDERNSHYPRSDVPEDPVPRIVGHPDNEPVSAASVRSAYANLIDGINRANSILPEKDRFCVPFAVQEALVRYIEEQEAITSIMLPRIAMPTAALPCCNYIEDPCTGMMQPGWPEYICSSCGARCGAMAHPEHSKERA